MNTYYLAIDIGASSGRHMLGHLENGKMILEEIYRFPNEMTEKGGHKCWDTDVLFREIINGMKRCAQIGRIPVSVGVDTWGVDFILLDEDDRMIGDAVAYRDEHTAGMDAEVYKIISEEDLYARTGIQKAIFNTIYQMMAVKIKHPEYLDRARTFLMLPDYFHFLLSGVKSNEYTNATTTGLVSPQTKQWDMELIETLGYPAGIFDSLKTPGTVIGELTQEVQAEVGFNCKVVLPATHDTGSAVLAVPSTDPDTIYISSGTWSLMGVERTCADTSPRSRAHNFTNEGGYRYRFRYLKNIMGLWMIQSVKKELFNEQGIYLTYEQLCDQAAKETITSLVNCNDDRFLAPENMTEQIRNACAGSGQQVPVTSGELACVIYNSLAKCYGDTVEELEEMTGRKYTAVNVVGGGSNAEYLNILTAHYTGRCVYAGPTEATAIGNLIVQMITAGELDDLSCARKCVFDSFAVKTYPCS